MRREPRILHRLTPAEASEVLHLHALGMSRSDIVIAMRHFRGIDVTFGQVQYLCVKTSRRARRGERPVCVTGRRAA